MAIEPVRGCGYRKIGGLYLVGDFISVPCDRMPYPLETCPTCGGGIKVGRSYTKINPFRLWGPHDYPKTSSHQQCKDTFRPCFMCDPKDEIALLMNVGAGYYETPEDFMAEGRQLGICKRIPHIPPELEVGKTIVYLTHPKACEVRAPVALQQAMSILEEAEAKQPKLLEAERVTKALGIFTAFIPQRIEKLIKESEATPETIEALKKRSITAIPVPDDDPDHK